MAGEKNKNNEPFSIRAPLPDAEELVRRVQERVREKRSAGVYDADLLSGVAALDFEQPLREEDFLTYQLQVVERLSDINFGDYEIVSKGGPLGKIKVLVPKFIWKLLRFYTFRLFSQQREFNYQVSDAMQTYYRWARSEIDRLTREVEDLKSQLPRKGGTS